MNITDQYVFAENGTVFVMNTRTSLAGDATPLGFHDEARYEFRVHPDGAPVESLALRVVFRPEADGVQAYQVSRLEGEEAASDTASGSVMAEGRTGESVRGEQGLTVWAGRVIDPFFLDLAQLGAVDKLVQHGETDAFAGFPSNRTTNTFGGSTVNSIVIRIPERDRVLFSNRSIRVWSTTRLATDSGGWRQISRAGLPMIWPVFRDADSDTASQANETHPADDETNYGKSIRDLVSGTVGRLGTSTQPQAYAEGVALRLTPDTLPYKVGTPAIFGFNGFNGRALADNAPEVIFSLVTNSAVSTGLPPASTNHIRTDTFPYVVPAG